RCDRFEVIGLRERHAARIVVECSCRCSERDLRIRERDTTRHPDLAEVVALLRGGLRWIGMRERHAEDQERRVRAHSQARTPRIVVGEAANSPKFSRIPVTLDNTIRRIFRRVRYLKSSCNSDSKDVLRTYGNRATVQSRSDVVAGGLQSLIANAFVRLPSK